MQILKGHISPETAYVVNDYPYGYTLRCKPQHFTLDEVITWLQTRA